ncbi:MAG: DEAD/DEAH box helicase family protein [Mycoplasmataceae bacterium]|nr:DEAD/DEAH box helicase family protein [Mycoplasmataceae bacterium]
MKFQFESSLPHQNKAIESVINLFEGIKTKSGIFSISRTQENFNLFNDTFQGFSNRIQTNNWTEEITQDNLNKIQEQNNLKKTKINSDSPIFDIEMETGTGKTYVFLKTILELNQKYDFKKFIIVVPSIAIKEGVLKSLEITKTHFKQIFPSINYNYYEYDGQSRQAVWNFANNDSVEIMILNIHQINKFSKNTFYLKRDDLSGDSSSDLIRQTRPILIIDEPQSSDGEKGAEAIKKMQPLFTLRYSATFKERKNEHLIYKLDSFTSYSQKLVKEIIVESKEIENSEFEYSYIKLISLDQKNQRAKIEIKKSKKTGIIKKEEVFVYTNDDLYMVSNKLEEYSNLKIDNINFKDQKIILSNGKEYSLGIGNEILDLKLKESQIKTTIEIHLKKQLELKKHNIKVLSLFFIDKVKNYREYDENGKTKPGKYAEIFQKQFIDIVSKNEEYRKLFDFTKNDITYLASKIHNGYFSIDKKKRFKDTQGNTKDDTSTYDKIMKDKEKLISFDEQLCFIFSHSALKEGWDNPNVFQICTLNETKSEMKKRQEIGRGLRLCVNQDGERIHDENINKLSVITNETYQQFVDSLQREMEEDGIKFGIINDLYFSTNINNIDQELSKKIFNFLKQESFIDKNNRFNPKEIISPEQIQNKFPELDQNQSNEIIDLLKNSYSKLSNIIKDGNKRKINKVKQEIIISNEFQNLWNEIKQKTIYKISINSKELAYECQNKIMESLSQLEKTHIVSQTHNIDIAKEGIVSTKSSNKRFEEIEISNSGPLIDIVSDIEKATDLKRKTIIEIIKHHEILKEIKIHPEATKKEIIKKIKEVKQKLMIKGIEYIKIDDYYEQHLLLEDEKEFFVEKYIDTKDNDKYPYEYIVYDSKVERDFGDKALKSEDVKKFIKLPNWFKIDTPLGKYNPDWALYDEREIIFIAETKGTTDENQLREIEKNKIKCGEKHFQAINKKIKFKTGNNFYDMISKSNGDN